MVQKPTVIVKKEFEEALAKLINDTPLPAFVMVPVIRETLRALTKIEDEVYAREEADYQKMLEEDKKKQEETAELAKAAKRTVKK